MNPVGTGRIKLVAWTQVGLFAYGLIRRKSLIWP